MSPSEIYNELKTIFEESIISFSDQEPVDPFITIKPESLFEICHTLRDNDKLSFDYLMSISALDTGETLGVVYHLYSMRHKHKVVLKTSVPKDHPEVASVERIWRSADWHEREAYDLVGVIFTGHHNLIRILCPYDWEGHSLRKDYTTPEYYHGMKIN